MRFYFEFHEQRSGHWDRRPNARVGVEVDPAVFFERLLERVGPFARQRAHS